MSGRLERADATLPLVVLVVDVREQVEGLLEIGDQRLRVLDGLDLDVLELDQRAVRIAAGRQHALASRAPGR